MDERIALAWPTRARRGRPYRRVPRPDRVLGHRRGIVSRALPPASGIGGFVRLVGPSCCPSPASWSWPSTAWPAGSCRSAPCSSCRSPSPTTRRRGSGSPCGPAAYAAPGSAELAHVRRTAGRRGPAHAAETILELPPLLNTHDRRTRGHSERVRAFADLIAEELRLRPGPRPAALGLPAARHRQARGPHRRAQQAGSWTTTSGTACASTPIDGARLAAPLRAGSGRGPARRQHHERWDGGGYPCGLAGAEISPRRPHRRRRRHLRGDDAARPTSGRCPPEAAGPSWPARPGPSSTPTSCGPS